MNMALPVLEMREATEISNADVIEVDIDGGQVKNTTTGKSYQAQPLSGLEKDIMHAGGLFAYLKKHPPQ